MRIFNVDNINYRRAININIWVSSTLSNVMEFAILWPNFSHFITISLVILNLFKHLHNGKANSNAKSSFLMEKSIIPN